MRWRHRNSVESIRHYERWRRWFAWYPVPIKTDEGDHWYWLCMVWRKREIDGYGDYGWKYYLQVNSY